MTEPSASVTFDRQRHRVYVRMEMDEVEWRSCLDALYLGHDSARDLYVLLQNSQREKSTELDWDRYADAPKLGE